MPTVLNEIGFFQFDNLIRGRIPFIILSLGVDLKDFYKIPLYQNHLEKVVIYTSADQAQQELVKKEVAPHEAILVLCPTGDLSAQAVDDLENAGFMNVFYVKNGFQALKADASH